MLTLGAFEESYNYTRTLQLIKNDDTQFGFYATYGREAVEYDTEYIQKYNGDFNATLIFAAPSSAVSPAFVTGVQSKHQSDSGERTSE